MKILLVDDEPVALKALEKRVNWAKYGFDTVLVAQDAQAARQVLDNHTLDMVLCDVEMPGEDGLSLVRHIRRRSPDTECIMQTCHAEFEYLRTALRLGVSDYILKPIDYEELDNLLSTFAENRQRTRQQVALPQAADAAAPSTEAESPVVNERIKAVMDYIQAHLQEKLYIEDLAKLVHVNEQHLMRVFKKETGRSITEYMAQQRVIMAGELLRTTDMSINLIADRVGCESCSYFTKLFRRYIGVTPSEYRKKN